MSRVQILLRDSPWDIPYSVEQRVCHPASRDLAHACNLVSPIFAVLLAHTVTLLSYDVISMAYLASHRPIGFSVPGPVQYLNKSVQFLVRFVSLLVRCDFYFPFSILVTWQLWQFIQISILSYLLGSPSTSSFSQGSLASSMWKF